MDIWAPVSASAPGGYGTWSTTSPTWTDTNGDGPGPMSPQPGLAIFQGAPGTVSVDDSAGSVSVTGMQFAVDGYTLTGGVLTLTGSSGSSPIIDVGDGTSGSAGYKATINNVLAGDAGLVKNDFGTLVLTGANTYTGGTTINAGTLALTGTGSIATSNYVEDDGSFDISGTTNGASISNLKGDGSVLLGNQTLTLVNGSSEFDGVISGTGGLSLSDHAVVVLGGANTFTGLTTINTGTALQVGIGGTGASMAGDVLDNGSLEFFHSDNIDYGGVISGTGSLVQEGTGTLTLTGSNTFGGGVTVLGATLNGVVLNSTLAVSNNANLGASSGTVTLNNGLLENTASFTLTHPVVLNSSGVPGVGGTFQTDSGTVLTV
ncbi:MAG TPA: autotransporter-associated beta strand repeat-containing protein, partial [Rhodanobacteraceae bacterium]|nr:autotransporter-associated beta strand repeat-containing protein [Rhodanobacteraceae bacterium]